MNKYRVVELFAGSRSFSKIAEQSHARTWSTDIEAYPGIDHVADIFDVTPDDIPFANVEVLWASPPCTNSVSILKRTIDVIRQINPKVWYLENPRGKMRRLPNTSKFPHIRRKVSYCQYGFHHMKSTDIWTNNPVWHPRSICKNDHCHTSLGRSMSGIVPPELCFEALTSAISYIEINAKMYDQYMPERITVEKGNTKTS